jgi:hypothetical protein
VTIEMAGAAALKKLRSNPTDNLPAEQLGVLKALQRQHTRLRLSRLLHNGAQNAIDAG